MDREMGCIAFTELDNGDWGRLGNQLFEIASAYGMAKDSNRDLILPANWRYRDRFNVPNVYFFDNIDVSKLVKFRHEGHLYVDVPDGDIDLQGWYQSYKYFHHYMDDIRKMFRHQDPTEYDYCAIHVRRTDYLDFGWSVCNREYYTDLIEKYNEKHILVFSDDIPWCKGEFGVDNNFTYVEEGDEVDQLMEMSYCHRIIAANSSYSWWACYLAKHNNCHFPRTWVKGIPYTETELILPEWQDANKHD